MLPGSLKSDLNNSGKIREDGQDLSVWKAVQNQPAIQTLRGMVGGFEKLLRLKGLFFTASERKSEGQGDVAPCKLLV